MLEHKAAFQAGEWIVDPELNTLRRGREERRVEPKVMKVLLALAERQNHVVSKEDLIAAVWPDTFVSDDVLTRCISVLRRVTHDDPQVPRFIQTVPKVGYRLIVDVEALTSAEPMTPAAPARQPEQITVATAPAPTAPTQEVITAAEPQNISPRPPASFLMPPRRILTLIVASVLLLTLVGVFALRTSRRQSGASERNVRLLPFTSSAGEQLQPAFAPDGQSIVYVAVGEDGSRHLYSKGTQSDTVQQLTDGAGQDYSPTWSPDGKQIAYLSRGEAGLGLYLETVATRQSRRIFTPQSASHWEQGALSWSPDGRTLLFPDHVGENSNSSIFELTLDTMQLRSLTTPPRGWEGDLTPAYSPDGRYIAFTRASETAVRDIYYMMRDTGAIHALTHDRSEIDSIAWTTGSDGLLFSSNRGGKLALWQSTLAGGDPKRLPYGAEDASQPAVDLRSGHVAYTQGSAVFGIDRVTKNGNVETVLASTQQDSAPSFSPDGKSFAFQSQRSGFQEIWTVFLNGTNARQLTHQAGPLTGSPAWAHAGSAILFDSRVNGHSHVFVIASEGGAPRQITFGDFNDITPRWSHDDSAVYFRSNRGGRWQVWKVSLAGGDPRAITTGDGIVPQESPDGKWLYFTRGDDSGIWRVPVDGGTEVQLQNDPPAGFWGYWQVTPRGIFYLHRDAAGFAIDVLNPETSQQTAFARIPSIVPMLAGLSVAPDGQSALLSKKSQAGRHITLVD